MVIDYRERKPVNKNRPKSKPVGLMFGAFVAVALLSFAAGALVDRLVFLTKRQEEVQAPGQAVAGKSADAAAQKSATSPAAGGAAERKSPPLTGEPPLTFYETLPKGGQAILGTGINTDKNGVPRTATAGSPAAPSAPQGEKGGAGESRKGESPRPPDGDTPKNAEKSAAAPQRKASPGGTFTVQVASAKERKEAEEIRKALVGKGYAAYIVETEIAGKGTWYRVRIGKAMDQGAASSLAATLGKGAIAIPGEIK